MNKKTIDYHLQNIEKNISFMGHKKDLEKEISNLREIAYRFKNTNLAIVAEKKAQKIESLLSLAIQKRIII